VIGMVEPRKMGAVSGVFNMFRNLGGPFGIAVSATLFGNRVVVRAKEAFLMKAAEAGIPNNLLEALARGRGITGEMAPDLVAKIKALGPEITEMQQFARAHGMVSAMADVAWVLVGVSVLTLLIAFLLPKLAPVARRSAKKM